MHTLRHTFAAHMVMAGVSLRAVQQLMGHATITTTEIYAHLAAGFAAQAVGALNLHVTKLPSLLSQLLSHRVQRSAKLLKDRYGEVPERPKGLPC